MFVFLSLCIYFERQKEREHVCWQAREGQREKERERERERQRENPKQTHAEPDVGLDPMNCEIMT